MSGSGKQFVRNGRASICEWILQASFKTREQAHGFIRDYLAEGGNALSFSYSEGFEQHCISYDLQIRGSWAANLSFIAELLERWDHDMDSEAQKP